MTRAEQEAWMAQWRVAAPRLQDVRRRELRGLTDAEALRASEALLTLAVDVPYPAERFRHSGLVRQQEIFHGRTP